ncbi:hypothetical protein [Chondrinema litorale]|uniref:hypothetical protein n=1 Tax=Chondrinema litorale TaxID=2994555 RepID=UPI002542CAB4|nr:hypothetical protein [Chondrinema litorale]UZR92839.1 hypothetical protein OQ292_13340 [Chondrinema litorale]
MIFDLVFFVLAFFMSIPLVGAWYASSRGRRFWLWYFLGLFFPIISSIILLCLPDIKNPIEKELQTIRIKNKMLGLKSETTNDTGKFNKLLNKASNRIAFEIEVSDKKKSIYPVIDNIPLNKIILNAKSKSYFKRKKDLIISYQGLPAEMVLPPSKHFLGMSNPVFVQSTKNNIVVLFDDVLEEHIYFKIELLRKYIIWHQFEKRKDNKLVKSYEKTGPFVFDRWQYELELNDVSYRYKKMV